MGFGAELSTTSSDRGSGSLAVIEHSFAKHIKVFKW